MEEKILCQRDEFYWLVLRSLISQQLVLFTRRKKGNNYHAACVCLLSAVWPQMPTTQATFYQWPDCWRRFLVLLVIDVIKPLPMIVLLNALLDPVWDPAKCFKFFSDKHCMQVATSSTFPSANDVIELCCILYNKTSIIATSFSQRTTAFEIFFIERTYTSDILF